MIGLIKLKNYLLREVLIWGVLFSSNQNRDMYNDNYINYGISYASTNVDSFNFQYAINVGDYESMSDYNNAMLGRRLADKVYPQDEGYDWNWESSKDRLKYRDMLRTSRDLDKIGDFAIAGLIIHRIVALINYNYLKIMVSLLEYHRTFISVILKQFSLNLNLIYKISFILLFII